MHLILKSRILLLVILTLFFVNCKKKSNPASNEVYLNNSKFDPTTLTVPVGTTVKWTNQESVTHTVTSDTGLFASGNLTQDMTYSFTFTTAGTYPYHCVFHVGMKGNIVVQ